VGYIQRALRKCAVFHYLISIVFTWIATSVILSYYRQKMGRIKFWLITISPLIFFLSQFAYLLPRNYRVISGLDPFFIMSMVTLIVLLSKPLGGTMLGVGFWSLSKSLQTEHVIKILLVISGFGFLLLFTSNQAFLLAIAPYPPFGTTTVMAIGLGAYMAVVGLYGSSIVIAQDAKLRQVIRKSVGSKLLDSLATGVVQKEIEGKVLQIVKQHANEMENQTGVQPSLSNEAKEYLKFVLEEIKKKETTLTLPSTYYGCSYSGEVLARGFDTAHLYFIAIVDRGSLSDRRRDLLSCPFR